MTSSMPAFVNPVIGLFIAICEFIWCRVLFLFSQRGASLAAEGIPVRCFSVGLSALLLWLIHQKYSFSWDNAYILFGGVSVLHILIGTSLVSRMRGERHDAHRIYWTNYALSAALGLTVVVYGFVFN